MPAPGATLSLLEAISARLEIITQTLDRTAQAIEANSEQVASLSESITRSENRMDQGFERIERNFETLQALLRRSLETKLPVCIRHSPRAQALRPYSGVFSFPEFSSIPNLNCHDSNTKLPRPRGDMLSG
jgi:ABC-type transporter Mla subunit MlaD